MRAVAMIRYVSCDAYARDADAMPRRLARRADVTLLDALYFAAPLPLRHATTRYATMRPCRYYADTLRHAPPRRYARLPCAL